MIVITTQPICLKGREIRKASSYSPQYTDIGPLVDYRYLGKFNRILRKASKPPQPLFVGSDLQTNEIRQKEIRCYIQQGERRWHTLIMKITCKATVYCACFALWRSRRY